MSTKKKLIRESFRNAVFKRDKFKCVFCNETHNLDAHHITNRNDMPNGGYVKENGISLCFIHHELAELYLNGIEKDNKYSPENLYKIINSNYELAVKESKKIS